jgi:hypothetical protein
MENKSTTSDMSMEVIHLAVTCSLSLTKETNLLETKSKVYNKTEHLSMLMIEFKEKFNHAKD